MAVANASQNLTHVAPDEVTKMEAAQVDVAVAWLERVAKYWS